tara:strand:+ start:3091 stop:3414 length:324 start_codon:yes stop_codon:yes gene_type:complete
MSDIQLTFLEKENDLNKVLRNQKKTKSSASILFVSLWDKWCGRLVKDLKEKYGSSTEGHQVFIVDSFRMPHAFVIFRSTKLPHLVKLRKDRVHSVDYLPQIYKNLSV